MGLAAYGEPEFSATNFATSSRSNGETVFGWRSNISPTIALARKCPGPKPTKPPCSGKMFSEELGQKLGRPRVLPKRPFEQRHRDLASSLQARLEEVYLDMLRKLRNANGQKSVCLAGGVAFNCVANGKIFDETPFEKVYVHPAAGDAGLAVGAAYYIWHQVLGKPRSFVMDHAYWGPGYTRDEIREALDQRGCAGRLLHRELPEEELIEANRAR